MIATFTELHTFGAAGGEELMLKSGKTIVRSALHDNGRRLFGGIGSGNPQKIVNGLSQPSVADRHAALGEPAWPVNSMHYWSLLSFDKALHNC
jgi:hypothetical protein